MEKENKFGITEDKGKFLLSHKVAEEFTPEEIVNLVNGQEAQFNQVSFQIRQLTAKLEEILKYRDQWKAAGERAQKILDEKKAEKK